MSTICSIHFIVKKKSRIRASALPPARSTGDCASRSGWTHNLGHLDNLLGNTRIERREHVGGGRISPALVTGFWLRRASHAVPSWNEWWVTVASAIAIDNRSCLTHERSRRSLRRRALPVPPAASRSPVMATAKFRPKGTRDTETLGSDALWWLWYRRC